MIYSSDSSGKICIFCGPEQRNQWVDLGIHTEACMTRPETCGAAGGAISMWVTCDWTVQVTQVESSHLWLGY